MTTTPTSLWGLAKDAESIHRHIEGFAESLASDDPEERQAAVEDLERELQREADNREALNRKADGYCYVVGNYRARAAARKAEAERLLRLAADDEHHADKLEEQLIRVLTMLQPEATRFELPYHKITSRRSTAVEVDPDADVPEAYVRVRRVESIDRQGLKQALRAGMSIPGVRLAERRSWKIG